MNEIPEYYTILFQAAEQAIQALEQQNYGLAKQILIDGEHALGFDINRFRSVVCVCGEY